MDNSSPNGLEKALPDWLPPEAFYALLGFMIFFFLLGIAMMLGLTQGRHAQIRRVKALEERRAELRGELVKRRRHGHKPEKGVDFIRSVVDRFRLLEEHHDVKTVVDSSR